MKEIIPFEKFFEFAVINKFVENIFFFFLMTFLSMFNVHVLVLTVLNPVIKE